MVPSNYAGLSRDQLAVLVPELLLIGQLIDRSGMAWCIQAFGREEMARIAIEEWAGASPVYTRRMQRALGYACARKARRLARPCNAVVPQVTAAKAPAIQTSRSGPARATPQACSAMSPAHQSS